MTDTHDRPAQLSPLYAIPEVQQASQMPRQVLLHDVTLRDGEQTPGVVFDTQRRLTIARALDALGVQRIEAGFPLISPDDREGVTAVAHAGLTAEIWGFGRCLPGDVQVNAECGVRRMTLEISISDQKIAAYGLTRERVMGRVREGMARAKELGLKVAFMPVDLTRADLRFAEQVLTEAANGGADEIVIVDTIGVMTPEAMAYLTRQIRSWVEVPLDAHVHNDFGLGVANTLTALKAGAHCAHVSVNCLGERAGNVDLAEIVVSLELLYGVSTGIRMEKLVETARLVEEESGYKLSLTKPIVGQCVFMREAGGVVQQMVSSPPSVEPFDPSLVGLERAVVLGKKSGRYSIIHALKRLGLQATEDQIDAALAKVKALSTLQRRAITDEEFTKILAAVKPA
jgi:isopropylmalate/homocitrate/citramalate synthase